MTAPAFLQQPIMAPRERLLAVLCDSAAAGAVCPSNSELVRLCGYAHGCTVSRALSEMEDEGLIEIERRGQFRAVTIAATGEATAMPVPAPEAPAKPEPPRRPVRDLAAVVSKAMDACLKDVLGGSCFREHVRARQLCAVLAVREGWSARQISQALGLRSHRSVWYARTMWPQYEQRDPALARLRVQLEAELPPLSLEGC